MQLSCFIVLLQWLICKMSNADKRRPNLKYSAPQNGRYTETGKICMYTWLKPQFTDRAKGIRHSATNLGGIRNVVILKVYIITTSLYLSVGKRCWWATILEVSAKWPWHDPPSGHHMHPLEYSQFLKIKGEDACSYILSQVHWRRP